MTEEVVKYEGQYQPSSIIKTLIDSECNHHLWKDRTGSGATHSVFSLSDERIILVAPTVQLVRDKEKDYKEGVFKGTSAQFLYGASATNLNDVKPSSYGHIVMGTADQIVHLNLEEFSEYSVIIDELHVLIDASTYREVLREPFIRLINHFAKLNKIITVTATPPTVYPSNMVDGFKLIKVENVIPKKRQRVGITYDKEVFYSYIEEAYQFKQNLISFSNNKRIHNKVIHQFGDENVKSILGSSLNINKCPLLGSITMPAASEILIDSRSNGTSTFSLPM